MQRLPLQNIFFFRWDEKLYHETTDNLMLYMVAQERIGSPEAVVIYFASKTCYLPKALPINHSQSQPFCLVTQREGAVCDKTKQLHGPGTNFLLAQPVIVLLGWDKGSELRITEQLSLRVFSSLYIPHVSMYFEKSRRLSVL